MVTTTLISCTGKRESTKYKLIGVVVHSGQTSGGHYYSYILHRYETVTDKSSV